MPEPFANSVFFTYVTKKSPQDVRAFYEEKMKELNWEFVQAYDY